MWRAPGATRNDWYVDSSLAGIGIVLVQFPFMMVMVGLGIWPITSNYTIVAGIGGCLVFAAMAFRRHYPPIAMAVVLVVSVVTIIVVPFPTVAWIVIPLTVYDISRWMPTWQSRLALGLWLVFATIAPFRWVTLSRYSQYDYRLIVVLSMVTSWGVLLTPYSIARRVHDVAVARQRQAAAEQESMYRQISEQIERQKHTEARVRTTIARELHDIVAHSIAVMIVQAEGGLAQLNKSPDKVEQALSTVAETGREALGEMRGIVRTLRSEADNPELPTTVLTLDAIPDLVDKAGAQLSVSGPRQAVTSRLATTIYRIVQEALTNALKHAGPDSNPRVSLEWATDSVTVRVENDLTEARIVSDSPGAGIIGMTERVLANAGILTVGPTTSGGFEVCARFPLAIASVHSEVSPRQSGLP